MRDPKRIPVLLRELGRLWWRTPDLRLTQLLAMLAKTIGPDPFYLEDDRLLEQIKNTQREYEAKRPPCVVTCPEEWMYLQVGVENSPTSFPCFWAARTSVARPAGHTADHYTNVFVYPDQAEALLAHGKGSNGRT